MKIAITGANGFFGRNLATRLGELGYTGIVSITRDTKAADLPKLLTDVGFVFHLAGVNRPKDPSEFVSGNAGFTSDVIAALGDRAVPIAFASSTQAALDNPYGASKRAAEDALLGYAARTGASAFLFRFPNIFGKWSRPNYNSAVATFCHNIARGLPITINDRAAALRLIYVDDAVAALVALLKHPPKSGFVEAAPVYQTTVGEVADIIEGFAKSRASLVTAPVGGGLQRALHATYLSFLPTDAFVYQVPVHADPRGEFVEMLKTADSGQFSYFTAGPGITRGEHYHHTKTEKFMVISGTAQFGFRSLQTGEIIELTIEGGQGKIVETVPGWAHNITNIGETQMVCMLWANEIFDRENPDTISAKVRP